MNTFNHHSIKFFLVASVILSLSGCVATMKGLVLDSSSESQLQKRSYQTRAFDTTDKQKVLRATSPPCRIWGLSLIVWTPR